MAGAVVLVALGTAAALSSGLAPHLRDGQEAEAAAMPTSVATATATATATAPPTSKPTSPASVRDEVRTPAAAPVHLTVESAGIDVAVLPLTPSAADKASQSLVPPFTLDGYWLTPYGMPGQGSTDTTYITGHSWEDRDAPFNRLSDSVKVGDDVVVQTAKGELRYVVDSITTENKDTLKDSVIWEIAPNRLVLISCYTEDPWGKNVVVTAHPAR